MKTTLLAVIAVLGLAASSARAASPDVPPADTEVWHGRYCTPLGCGPAPRGSAADAVGFGAAVLGCAWLARRSAR